VKLLPLLLAVVFAGVARAKPVVASPDENLSNALQIATDKIDCGEGTKLCAPSVSRLKCTRQSVEASRHCEFTDSAGKSQRISGRKAGPLFEALRQRPEISAYCQKQDCSRIIELDELSCESFRENAAVKTSCRFKPKSEEAKAASTQSTLPAETTPGSGAK
jgi:hypothetical protein